MRIRRIIVGTVVVVVGLPLVVIMIALVWISVLDRPTDASSPPTTRGSTFSTPDSYHPTTPAPLIISMHAGATWPAQQKNLSRWNRIADENGFIVVYPSGTPQLVNVARIWHTFDRGAGLERDVRFISELIDTLRSAYNIDPARIYANGMSNGGGMAFVLSCTLSDRIAAVGMVAPAQSLPRDWCTATRPVPMIAFQGTADPMVPYDGGRFGDPFNPVKPVFPAVRDFVAHAPGTPGLCRRRLRGPLYRFGRRAHLAGRQAVVGMEGRTQQQQH